MDYGRPYRTMMAFSAGGPLVPVRWYYADPNADVFPGFHRFASATWEQPGDREPPLPPYDGPGEVVPPFYAHDPQLGENVHGTLGTTFAGSVEVYQRGQIPSDPTWVTDAEGHSPTCDRPRPVGNVGVVLGGVTPPFPGPEGRGMAQGEAFGLSLSPVIVAGSGTAAGQAFTLATGAFLRVITAQGTAPGEAFTLATGAATATALGTAAGEAFALGASGGMVPAYGTAAGEAFALATGAPTSTGSGTAAGEAFALATGAPTSTGSGTAAGEAFALAGAIAITSAVGTAAGEAFATGQAGAAKGTALGDSTATATGGTAGMVVPAVGHAFGEAFASAGSLFGVAAPGTGPGDATAAGHGGAGLVGAGSTPGDSTATATGRIVQASGGTAPADSTATGAGSYESVQWLQLRSEYPQGTNGGNNVAGSWQNRDMTKAIVDPYSLLTGFTGLSFSLKAGTYRLRGWQSFVRTNGCKTQLLSSFQGVVVNGECLRAGSANDITVTSMCSGRFTSNGTELFSFQYLTEVVGTNGLGAAVNQGLELYALLELEKE